MKARNIKPSFFTDSDLGKCSPLARLLFEGLWCEVDRDGRTKDKPEELKVKILPYDKCDIDKLLDSLQPQFITRYEVDGKRYIQVNNFLEHQSPHKGEKSYNYPAPPVITGNFSKLQEDTGVVMNDESLNMNDDINTHQETFDKFWKLWPTGRKIDKKSCVAKWNRIKSSELQDVITGTRNYISANKGKDIEYLKHPLTLLNKETWRDYLNWQPPEDTTVREKPYILDGKESPYGPGVLRKFVTEGKIKQVSDRNYITIDQTKDPPGDMSRIDGVLDGIGTSVKSERR